jgi:TATA-box binding protein (TBP) (component of TFIID and TFIIIB)
VIHEMRHLTVCEVSEEAVISKSPCHITLTKKLDLHHVAIKFVPHLCTYEHENFLNTVIRGVDSFIWRS